jgi:hypothetical protein
MILFSKDSFNELSLLTLLFGDKLRENDVYLQTPLLNVY